MVVPTETLFVNQELKLVMERIDDMSNTTNRNLYDVDSVKDESHLLANESCLKAPIFHRMQLQQTESVAEEDTNSLKPSSISSIIMESWEGSHVYKLGSLEPNANKTKARSNSDTNDGKANNFSLVVEISIKVVNFLGNQARLVMIRNVSYILE